MGYKQASVVLSRETIVGLGESGCCAQAMSVDRSERTPLELNRAPMLRYVIAGQVPSSETLGNACVVGQVNG